MFAQFVVACLGGRGGLWGSLRRNVLMLNNHVPICFQLSFRLSVCLFRMQNVERREIGHRGNDRVGRVNAQFKLAGRPNTEPAINES